MKHFFTIMLLYMTALLTGCDKEPGWETMQLLDEEVVEIRISAFESWDEMNGDTLLSFKDTKAVRVFEEAIRTARKQADAAKRTDPDYDVMVIYRPAISNSCHQAVARGRGSGKCVQLRFQRWGGSCVCGHGQTF